VGARERLPWSLQAPDSEGWPSRVATRFASGVRRNRSIPMSGPTWWIQMNASTQYRAARTVLHCFDESALPGVLECVAGLLDDRAAPDLDRGLLDVGVHAAEHAGEQVAAEHQGLGGHRLAEVGALMKGDPSRL
jgi:hypothetical protein